MYCRPVWGTASAGGRGDRRGHGRSLGAWAGGRLRPGRRPGHTVLMDGSDQAAAFTNIEQAEFWSELAPTWLALEDQLEEVAGPPGKLAMDRLGLRAG